MEMEMEMEMEMGWKNGKTCGSPSIHKDGPGRATKSHERACQHAVHPEAAQLRLRLAPMAVCLQMGFWVGKRGVGGGGGACFKVKQTIGQGAFFSSEDSTINNSWRGISCQQLTIHSR